MVEKLNGSQGATGDDHLVAAQNPWIFRGLIAGQASIYGAVASLSCRFDYTSDFQQRPILLVLLLLSIAFILHIGSLRIALRSANQGAVTRSILFGAVLFRVILLPSLPIQEVDIYRYLWDGAVVADGGNPYRFSPQQVLTASSERNSTSSVSSLVDLQTRSGSCAEALRRIHYAELITVYPPVSQIVFGLASFAVPDRSSLYQRIVTMKIVLTLFDLATVWLLIGILRCVGRQTGWAILYAWSPLVLKEFANSGHLDSIAVCLTTMALFCLLRARVPINSGSGHRWLMVSAVMLGLGVGAKLYPVLLIPVLALWTVRTSGKTMGVTHLILSLTIGIGCISPMLLTKPVTTEFAHASRTENTVPAMTSTAGSGLATFLSRWEINDLLFLIIVENLRPDTEETPLLWFVITPDHWRIPTAEFLSSILHRPIPVATFLTARLITLLVFVTIFAVIQTRAWSRNEDEFWLRTVFLTLAWFWMLAPTQNPWYWTWALPFLPFAGRKTWTVVSLVVLAYYFLFWLLYQFPDAELLGTGHRGEHFFHYIVAPMEHSLWLFLLMAESLFSRYVVRFTDWQTPLRVV